MGEHAVSDRMRRAWVGLLLAAMICCLPDCSAPRAATRSGAAILALLDDPDAGVRAYGWTTLERFGAVSEANPLQERRFMTFIAEDRNEILARIAALSARSRASAAPSPTSDQRKSGDADLAVFLQVAKLVPELAALVVAAPGLADMAFPADVRAIREAALRPRPVKVLAAAPAGEIDRQLAVLADASGQDEARRFEAATALAGFRLSPRSLDRVVELVESPSRRSNIRGQLGVALARNGRIDAALSVVDRLLDEPSGSKEARISALGVLTSVSISQPAAGQSAIAARADKILPLLGDLDTLIAAAALLGQIEDERIAERIPVELLKLVEDGENLALSSCAHIQTLRRSAEWPLGLAVIARGAEDTGDRVKLAGCAMLLAPSAPQRAMARDLALEADPPDLDVRRQRLAMLHGEWGRLDMVERKGFWKTADAARRLVVRDAARLADAIPFTWSGAADVDAWIKRAEPLGSASLFSRAYWIRRIATYVPTALGLLGGWVVALVALVLGSQSEKLRAFLLFHPFGKQFGALGQVQTLVFAVASLRRRFFRPYRVGMLGALAEVDDRATHDTVYFAGSGAAELQRGGIAGQIRELDRRCLTELQPPAPAVVEALGHWRGRVLLIGPSGRGKTMFLRHVLAQGGIREPALFTAASALGVEPLKALTARFGGAIPDEAFLDSLIRAGKIDLYIDGLNEADPDTRAAILDFIAARPASQIFVTTQPLERYPSDARLFSLLPLTRTQVIEFLISRESTLAPDAPLRGDVYRDQSRAFVSEKLAEADARGADAGIEELERARALVERLANPMDLQTIADLLSLGQRPNVWALQRQRHLLVERRYRERTNDERFPLLPFSRSVYEGRRDGRPDVDRDRFPRVTEILLEEKQIQRYVAAGPGIEADGFVFRHDKIRDFYTYLAFVEDPTLRTKHAGDDQFSGIYDLLSLELPQAEAAELREYLAERALDRGDHRLSDRYLEGLRARRSLERKDPEWLSAYDRADVAGENAAIALLDAQREELLTQSAEAVARLDEGRAATRIVCAARSDALLASAAAVLAEAGFLAKGIGAGQRSIFDAPEGFRFGVLGLAHHGRLPEPIIAALQATLAFLPSTAEPTLVVVNAEADIAPERRDGADVSALTQRLTCPSVAICSAPDLLIWARSSPEAARRRIERLWSAG
jgi:hypothetical protein